MTLNGCCKLGIRPEDEPLHLLLNEVEYGNSTSRGRSQRRLYSKISRLPRTYLLGSRFVRKNPNAMKFNVFGSKIHYTVQRQQSSPIHMYGRLKENEP